MKSVRTSIMISHSLVYLNPHHEDAHCKENNIQSCVFLLVN